jgi:hypothetical protein
MRKVVFGLVLAALTINYGQAQIASGLKDKIASKGKKDKQKDIGVEIIEDEAGISGTYYVWYPPTLTNNWFKKISKVAIQYKPDDGKKLIMYASKKEFTEYYTSEYVRNNNMTEVCGLYAFKSSPNFPTLWTIEPGMFISLDVVDINSVTCEFNTFKKGGYKTYIMSTDKELIDGMTLEKFQEIVKAQKISNCQCVKGDKMDKNPAPERKLIDAEIEAATLKLIKAKAEAEHWAEEISGVYIASEKWGEAELWTNATEWNSAERMNVVIVMKNGSTCSYQRAVIANKNWKLGENGSSLDDGISLAGIIPENNPMSCTSAEKLLE